MSSLYIIRTTNSANNNIRRNTPPPDNSESNPDFMKSYYPSDICNMSRSIFRSDSHNAAHQDAHH